MSMVFKKLQNKILVHMKTFDKAYIRIWDHLLGREKYLSVFFPNSLYIVEVWGNKKANLSKTPEITKLQETQ